MQAAVSRKYDSLLAECETRDIASPACPPPRLPLYTIVGLISAVVGLFLPLE